MNEEIRFTLELFGQELSWTLLIFAVIGMVIYLGFRHTWALINTIIDHYILKKNPEYVIRRNMINKYGKLYYDNGPYEYLKDRVKSLEKEKKRPLERRVLKDILNSMSEVTPKYTGKNKTKVRGKGTLRQEGVKRKVSAFR